MIERAYEGYGWRSVIPLRTKKNREHFWKIRIACLEVIFYLLKAEEDDEAYANNEEDGEEEMGSDSAR